MTPLRGTALLVCAAQLAVGDVSAQARAGAGPTLLSSGATTVSYDVDGVRVIHRFVTSGDIVVANAYLLGGVRQVTAANAGIELLLLEATERGTRTFSRDRLRRTMAGLGTSITTHVGVDWSVIGLRATSATFDSTWAILASRLTEPTLDSADVELTRQQLVAAVRQRDDSPDQLVEALADSFAFSGHPYALQPTGTEASLARVSLAALRDYQKSQIVKSRMLVVVVGNVTRDRITRLVRATLGRLPAGNYAWSLPDTLPRLRAAAHTVSRALPTNYVLGLYPGPRADSRDYHALRIATAILSGQLYSEIRSRRNLTYAVNAPFIERAVAAGGLYVTTTSPETALLLMRRELSDLQTGVINPAALEQLILQFITQYFLDNESSAQQADFLARAELYYGDYRRAERFVDELRAITPADIQQAAQRYMRDVRFVLVGNPSQAAVRAMERF